MLSEVKRIRILLRKTTFGDGNSLLFSIEETQKSKRKAVNLSFFIHSAKERDVSTACYQLC